MRRSTTLKLALVFVMLTALLMPEASRAFAARDDGPSPAAIERMTNVVRGKISSTSREKGIGVCSGCVCVVCRQVGQETFCREYILCA